MSYTLSNTIGIDFGTTNSCCYVAKNDQWVEVLPGVKYSSTQYPSYVCYKSDEVVVGDAAKSRIGKNDSYVVSAAKRIIGLTYQEYLDTIDSNVFGCDVVEGEDGYPYFVVLKTHQQVSPREIATILLKEIKIRAEAFCDCKKDHAYISFPANYKDRQVAAIREAAINAGFSSVKVCTEPTAAAMSWCLEKEASLPEGCRMLVYDFGGGTFDVSLIQYWQNGYSVTDSDGDDHIGGNDVDTLLLEYIKQEYAKRAQQALVIKSNRRLAELRRKCELAKVELSYKMESVICINDDDENDITLTRAGFSYLIDTLLSKTIACIERLLKRNGVSKGNIAYVFVVGGSSQIPAVGEKLKRFFPATTIFPAINKEVSVAKGVMLYARNDILRCNDVKETTYMSYGIEQENGDVAIILSKGCTLPANASLLFYTADIGQDRLATSIYQTEENCRRNDLIRKDRCVRIRDVTISFVNKEMTKPLLLEVEFRMQIGGVLIVVCRNANTREILGEQKYNGIYEGR